MSDVVAQPEPSTKGEKGRSANGKFAKGYKGGPGNPHAKRVAKLRATFLNVVTPQQYRRAVRACLKKAIQGDVVAFKELNDRLLGKSKQPIEVSGGKKALSVKATLDFAQFVRELDDVEREREAAAGGMVPPHRN